MADVDHALDHFADRLSSASAKLYEQILALGLLIVLAMVVYFAVASTAARKPGIDPPHPLLKTEAAPPEAPRNSG